MEQFGCNDKNEKALLELDLVEAQIMIDIPFIFNFISRMEMSGKKMSHWDFV